MKLSGWVEVNVFHAMGAYSSVDLTKENKTSVV
jgi:hypothetical protein